MLEEVFEDVDRRMNGAVEAVRRQLASIRTGRANLSMLDGVEVDYYGTDTPLNQVAKLSTPEPSLIVVQPWEAGMLEKIERAILKADLGLNPTNDGKVIRLPIPPLTEESRKKLVRRVSEIGEEGKVAVRQVRRDGKDKVAALEKDKSISQDDEHRAYTTLDKSTERHVEMIDDVVAAKEKQLMEV